MPERAAAGPERVSDPGVCRRGAAEPRPDILVDVVIVEAQLGARSLQEVLPQGLLPRVVKIRQRAEKVIKDVDTLESLIVLAFAEAVAAYPREER